MNVLKRAGEDIEKLYYWKCLESFCCNVLKLHFLWAGQDMYAAVPLQPYLCKQSCAEWTFKPEKQAKETWWAF